MTNQTPAYTDASAPERPKGRHWQWKVAAFLAMVLVISAGVSVAFFQTQASARPDFSETNKVQLLAEILNPRYAKAIRQAGFEIPPDGSIRLLGMIDELYLRSDLDLTVGVPRRDSEDFGVYFTYEIAGKETQVSYDLDGDLGLVSSSYVQRGEDKARVDITVDAALEAQLLARVQKQINAFIAAMKEQMTET